jgi:hypothetical protein
VWFITSVAQLPGDWNDAHHPNGAGYRVLMDSFWPVVVSTLPHHKRTLRKGSRTTMDGPVEFVPVGALQALNQAVPYPGEKRMERKGCRARGRTTRPDGLPGNL